MKKILTSAELLIIEEILNKYGSDSDTTVTDFELGLLTKLYEVYQHLVRHIDKTEAENNSFRNTIKNMKENFTEHLNALEAENHDLKKQIEDVKKQTYDMYSHKLVKLHFLEAENQKLKDQVTQLHTIKKSFEVLRALYLGDYENDEPF